MHHYEEERIRLTPYTPLQVKGYIPDPVTRIEFGDHNTDTLIHTQNYHVQVGTKEGYVMACAWAVKKLVQMDPCSLKGLASQIKTVQKRAAAILAGEKVTEDSEELKD